MNDINFIVASIFSRLFHKNDCVTDALFSAIFIMALHLLSYSYFNILEMFPVTCMLMQHTPRYTGHCACVRK